MLDPSQRSVLFEAMRPPPGTVLDRALGTTFTLDLVTLLATPLAFTRFGAVDDAGSLDSLEVLESVRRFIDRIAIFCQAGFIKAPLAKQTLLGFLREAVVEVKAAQSGGLFHPKVWVLRFAGDENQVLYRLLVLSRNHTFDRSWDTVFTLDGELSGRKRGYAQNRPLSDFISALPSLAIRRVPERVSEAAASIAEEIRRVAWTLPEDVEEIRFWPMGIEGHRALPMKEAARISRLAVVSPFLSEEGLARLSKLGPIAALISREESLAGIRPRYLSGVEECLILQRDLDIAEDESETPTEGTGAEPPSTGLHAKLYVADDGWNARVWTGSANATRAGFERNVELMVELTGKRRKLGVEALLGDTEGTVQLRHLLTRYDPERPGLIIDEELEAAGRQLDSLRQRLGEMEVRGVLEPAEDGLFALEIRFGEPLADVAAEVRVWPVSLGDAQAALLSPGQEMVAFVTTREAITPFIAFEIALPGSPAPPARFVLNIPLEGLPADYHDVLLRSVLRSRRDVVRYLIFLLAESGLDGPELERQRRRSGDDGRGAGAADTLPLAEQLVRTLARAPERLDPIFTLVSQLESDPESRALLPEGFLPLWSVVWEARQKLR